MVNFLIAPFVMPLLITGGMLLAAIILGLLWYFPAYWVQEPIFVNYYDRFFTSRKRQERLHLTPGTEWETAPSADKLTVMFPILLESSVCSALAALFVWFGLPVFFPFVETYAWFALLLFVFSLPIPLMYWGNEWSRQMAHTIFSTDTIYRVTVKVYFGLIPQSDISISKTPLCVVEEFELSTTGNEISRTTQVTGWRLYWVRFMAWAFDVRSPFLPSKARADDLFRYYRNGHNFLKILEQLTMVSLFLKEARSARQKEYISVVVAAVKNKRASDVSYLTAGVETVSTGFEQMFPSTDGTSIDPYDRTPFPEMWDWGTGRRLAQWKINWISMLFKSAPAEATRLQEEARVRVNALATGTAAPVSTPAAEPSQPAVDTDDKVDLNVL